MFWNINVANFGSYMCGMYFILCTWQESGGVYVGGTAVVLVMIIMCSWYEY